MSPDRRLLARQERRHRRGCGRLVGQALAIDAEVLAYPLNVVARFVEGNALDPVDKISAAGSRITVRRDPLHHPAAAGVIRRERQGVRAALVLQDLAEEGRAERLWCMDTLTPSREVIVLEAR